MGQISSIYVQKLGQNGIHNSIAIWGRPSFRADKVHLYPARTITMQYRYTSEYPILI